MDDKMSGPCGTDG